MARQLTGATHAGGIAKVQTRFKGMSLKGGTQMDLQVGYGARYAIYVHERLDLFHMPPTQAKFLSGPARQWRKWMMNLVTQALLKRRSLYEGLIDAGNFLLQKSLPLVPVDTGYLRRSHYVRIKRK